ncbi:MAG TPA: hypothetical protein VE487_00100 [Ilumatobacter sp.]|jgi:hypothetical protein|nr:hypothetical protein [Ilumatobacter sp.]
MSEYEEQKAKLNFSTDIDYYDSTDFGLLSAEVDNDAWIGAGDAMATLAILRNDGTGEQVYLPVTVDNPPVTRGAKVTFPIENLTRQVHGEAQISLIDLSGAEAGGASDWTVFYGPIRNPFDE